MSNPRPLPTRLLALCPAIVCLSSVQAEDTSPDRHGVEFFERNIRPVLIEHCYECHSAQTDELDGGLRLDTRSGLREGGESGPAIVPGEVGESLLIQALEYESLEMPPDDQLPEGVIADFRRWVRMGAPDPRDDAAAPEMDNDDESSEEPLWSLRPVATPDPPRVENKAWVRGDVDRYILARLESNGLHPVADADPHTLLRRLYFDLVGLPPSPEESGRFANDPDVAAVVHRLLESPQFGERWARHWLDVVRYGESAGSSRDVLMPWAWRYRDYVIDALNDDVPYDRFVTEQIAGDLLGADSTEERDRLQIATGLLAIGSKSLNGGNVELDLVDDQIDVVGKAVMGLTVSCARCHDHKFDPIPTADYYALAGIFSSTQTYYGGNTNRPGTQTQKLNVYLPLGENAADRAREVRRHEKAIAELQKEKQDLGKELQQLRRRLGNNWEQRRDALAEAAPAVMEEPSDELRNDAESESPRELSEEDRQFLDRVARMEAGQVRMQELNSEINGLQSQQVPTLDYALGVRDSNRIADAPIQIRGEKNQRGDVVPRGVLSCVTTISGPIEISADSSGRLELARWLTHSDHPLTARVIVNRVWQHLFGRGLVETVDNFGAGGMPPTHPELLDYLAWRLVHEHNWSLKGLIREIVLSHVYQLSSEYDESNYAADAANELFWRMNRRRLEAEAIRDAMLSAGGNLHLSRPHASAVLEIGEGEVGRGINLAPLRKPFPHRSVYLPIIRGIIPEPLKVFDFPEPSNPQGLRDATNVPAQSLYLMNSPFVIAQSEQMARRITAAETDDLDRLQLAFVLCYARPPAGNEIAESLDFLSRFSAGMAADEEDEQRRAQLAWSALCQALFASAEFRYID